ncbi:MAG TPA: hypothetical protein PKB14_18385 [Rubrivivax sp.]|nr:hypothetical protein [Rubrivivax sp.]
MTQGLITALIVAGCAVYVVWRLLLPAAAKRHILRALGRQPTASASCGGCHGCDGPATAAKPPSVQKVHWMPRRRG